MDIKKIVLYAIVAFLGVSLWNAWLLDYSPKAPQSVEATAISEQTAAEASYAPPSFNPEAASHYAKTKSKSGQESQEVTLKTPDNRIIEVKTDVLKIRIDRLGGNIISAELLKYPASLKEKEIPVQILKDDPNNLYVAQSGLTNIAAEASPHTAPLYTSVRPHYELQPNEVQLNVVLEGKTSNGLLVTKTYRLHRDQYVMTVNMKVKNASSSPWSGSFYGQIKRQDVPSAKQGFMQPKTYEAASISSTKTPYEKLTYKAMDQADLSREIQGGWLAMQQHYFVSAWVPPSDGTYHYYSHVSLPASGEKSPKVYTLGYVAPEMTVTPGQVVESSSRFYIGPEIASRLKAVAHGLDLTIDYGWLWMVSEGLFWLMDKINHYVRNWGWSIILVTAIIKLVFYKLSDSSYRSMAKMRELAPKLKALKERYGDDKQRMSQETMQLYRREKINPLGGCLPMVVQIPVFIAFYYVLFESVELRQAPWILWVQDLSMRDPYYILPILMGLSMFAQQRLSPAPPDPAQAKMMMALPLVFTVLFLSFPAGLVLYWLVNNCLSILQQWYIMRRYEGNKGKGN